MAAIILAALPALVLWIAAANAAHADWWYESHRQCGVCDYRRYHYRHHGYDYDNPYYRYPGHRCYYCGVTMKTIENRRG